MAVGDAVNISNVEELVAPATVTRGNIYLIGATKYGVAMQGGASGALLPFITRGGVEVRKNTGVSSAIALNGKVYYRAGDNTVSGDATGNTLIGRNIGPATVDASTSAIVELDTLPPTLT